MENRNAPNRAEILRLLPSIDRLLKTEKGQALTTRTGTKQATALARNAVDSLRREILAQDSSDEATGHSSEALLIKAERNLEQFQKSNQSTKLQRVINATGVIIHTNLGRAPLSENARKAINEEASRYCTLEYDLETGSRGKRGARAEQLLAELTGAEAALIVNNCAAACILVLTVLAQGGETILSRGEMVEIGGDFRIPDVMIQSGAILREVGTTNRTKVADYERAIIENTRLIVKVHPSNYRIIGFTSTPSIAELVETAHRNNVLLYEDAGSGALIDLSGYGLNDEPLISDSIKAGADVVTFSGDKLLGGVQSGLIVGKAEVIERLRKHPLYRALRVDKIAYAALEATLEAFQRETATEEIPVLRMLSATKEEIRERTENFVSNLREGLNGKTNLDFEVIDGNSVVGGGSAPDVQPATELLVLKHSTLSTNELEEKLRFSQPPVITRILEDKVLIDLRTVFEDEEAALLRILTNV